MKLLKVLEVLKALVKPISTLIKDLEDGKISEDERDQLVMEFSLAVSQIVVKAVEKDK